jgi:hypothetical protein
LTFSVSFARGTAPAPEAVGAAGAAEAGDEDETAAAVAAVAAPTMSASRREIKGVVALSMSAPVVRGSWVLQAITADIASHRQWQ